MKSNPQNGGIRHRLNLDKVIAHVQPNRVTPAVLKDMQGQTPEGKPTVFTTDPRSNVPSHLLRTGKP